MSKRPQGFGFFCATGWGFPSLFAKDQAYSSSCAGSLPNEYALVVPARQQSSHSASVGSR
jgi:hypothetical protein